MIEFKKKFLFKVTRGIVKSVEGHWGDKKDTKGHEKDARCVRKDVGGTLGTL
jgi:hypothetical protein